MSLLRTIVSDKFVNRSVYIQIAVIVHINRDRADASMWSNKESIDLKDSVGPIIYRHAWHTCESTIGTLVRVQSHH